MITLNFIWTDLLVTFIHTYPHMDSTLSLVLTPFAYLQSLSNSQKERGYQSDALQNFQRFYSYTALRPARSLDQHLRDPVGVSAL